MTSPDQPQPQRGAESDAPARPYELTLFVTGQTVRSTRAVATLRWIAEQLRGSCELTIIDVLERPRLAEDERILATPTVIRRWPTPPRRLIGDLSDIGKVILGLDLPPLAVPADEGRSQ
jgi:circadian clock protein KaiB